MIIIKYGSVLSVTIIIILVVIKNAIGGNTSGPEAITDNLGPKPPESIPNDDDGIFTTTQDLKKTQITEGSPDETKSKKRGFRKTKVDTSGTGVPNLTSDPTTTDTMLDVDDTMLEDSDDSMDDHLGEHAAVMAGLHKDVHYTNRWIRPTKKLCNAMYLKTSGQKVNYENLVKVCNPPSMIKPGVEGNIGLLNNNFKLQSIIVLTRHGDRGPMYPINNINTIDCGISGDLEYLNYMKEISTFHFLGPFNEFTKLLPTDRYCTPSELTPVGVSQMLKLGRILRTVYSHLLGGISSEDIIIYSTQYNRTVQSALALMYALLPMSVLLKVEFQKSLSYNYCFDHCECPITTNMRDNLKRSSSNRLKTNNAIESSANRMHRIIYGPNEKLNMDPYLLRDSIMTYVCHGEPLPSSENFGSVSLDDVRNLFNYLEQDMVRYATHGLLERYGLLKSYGLAQHIASNLLALIRTGKPRLVVYSGHDLTTQYLLSAFGVLDHHIISPHYASRLVIEIYRDNNTVKDDKNDKDNKNDRNDKDDKNNKEEDSTNGFYFRVVFNGRDVTESVKFCKDNHSLGDDPEDPKGPQDPQDSQYPQDPQVPAHLCPVNLAIKFIKEEYFTLFNVSNFEEACAKKIEELGVPEELEDLEKMDEEA
ncbi:Histidine phosphatase superfamily,Histidine phosphatase superfamily, clade-2,Histidine acid [Cinara cedri]|uniref:2-phosphoxylose phosphatase 1 n=1 Tax=Cinara cedri TaxID=506608 RepID=A0A5E4M554_9HEMI|nr:Histidine phosphatase superfamily,Histidine phosphatase superfamily, clade-2,Histidine acid [Cinara cedri]